MKRFTPSLWTSLSRVAIGQLASHGYLSPTQADRWSPTTAASSAPAPLRAPRLAACARAACCA